MAITMLAGARTLASGLRRGNAAVAALGAAILALAWVRRTAGPRSQLVHAEKVVRGEAIEIRVTRPRDQRTR
ncbi:MAG: hypothetical protein QY307_01280 [Acidimicrobiia bacterium]|nr:MAG: hypothetical protein QY307_01280 [Acidimicrobiia bacterium]